MRICPHETKPEIMRSDYGGSFASRKGPGAEVQSDPFWRSPKGFACCWPPFPSPSLGLPGSGAKTTLAWLWDWGRRNAVRGFPMSSGLSTVPSPWPPYLPARGQALRQLCKGVPALQGRVSLRHTSWRFCTNSLCCKVCRSIWASVFGSESANVFIWKGKCFC